LLRILSTPKALKIGSKSKKPQSPPAAFAANCLEQHSALLKTASGVNYNFPEDKK
jgi:hypothetical protein